MHKLISFRGAFTPWLGGNGGGSHMLLVMELESVRTVGKGVELA